MSSSLEILTPDVAKLGDAARFIELQIHDTLQKRFDIVKQKAVLPEHFGGYLTLHGEGETDGKRKIKFSSSDENARKHYICNCVNLYKAVIRHFPVPVMRIILHPDTLSPLTSREVQIEQLAKSLAEIQEQFQAVDICIEPRGGNKQGKVLRAHLEDILCLERHLSLYEGKSRKIGLCIDVAQVVIVHGNSNAMKILEQISKSSRLPILEFHASDVALNQNRVAVEVGKGRVDWTNLLPIILSNCKSILIETLGGPNVFQRSRNYIESLVKNT